MHALPPPRFRLRLTPLHRQSPPREPGQLFLGLALALVGLGFLSSCVAHRSLIEEAWREAVLRSGFPREEIRRPEVLEPPGAFSAAPSPRDEHNRPIVAQYFPLSHQVRIYSKLALPMRKILLREFLYAIYFDRLTTRPVDLEALSAMEPARVWVEQALARSPESGL